MTRFFRTPATAFALVVRAIVFSVLLAAPVLAVPAASSDQGQIIEAPNPPKTGLGLVLLVSLQRA